MRKKILGLVAVLATLGGGVVLLASDPADAQKVANPQTATLSIDSGSLALKQHSAEPLLFEAGSAEEPVLVTLQNITAAGTFNVSSVQFPPIPPQEGPLGPVNITISRVPTGSLGAVNNGTINPITGAMTLNFSLRIDLDGSGLGGDCRVEPIHVSSRTGTTTPPPPNTPISGVPYNPDTGRVTLVDNAWSVPNSSGCGFLAEGPINDLVASPAGHNSATFSGGISPIILPAVTASFTATPNSGFAPLPVAFNAAASTSSLPNPTYQWDFTNDGSFDATGVVTNFVYASPGSYTARLRVTDSQGDFAETTRSITVVQPFTDATLDKSGPATAAHGDPVDYDIVVGSAGDIPTPGVTVVDTLPAGLTYQGSTGTGWVCAELPAQTITCTHADAVNPGDAYPTLQLQTLADGSFTGTVTNTASVTTTGEIDFSDNADSVETLLIAPGVDLDVDKTHDLDDGLFVGERATYIVKVDNDGTASAVERTRIVDVLPTGLEYVSAAGGLDWVCSYDSPSREVRCFSDKDLAPGDALADINIRVDVTGAVETPVTNTATVSNVADANPTNNSDDDTGDVLGLVVDYQILKSHIGDVVTGEPATYGIGVKNVGTANGGGPVTVTDELPAGLTYVSAVGDGWTCGAVGQLVTCDHPDGAEAGDVMPGISIQAMPDPSLGATVENTATVAGPADANPANDESTVENAVRGPRPDLTLSKTHVGNFVTQANGSWTITVRNLAPERADGPTTVVDTLPAGLAFVSAGGTGWTCDASALPQVTCEHLGTIAGLATAAPITITVVPPDGSDGIVTNIASVANAQDVDNGNNGVVDPTRIEARARIVTTIEADAIVLKVKIAPNLQVSLLNAPYAVLKAGATPVPGKLVTFRAPNGNVLCSGTTNAQGAVTCGNGLQTYLATLGSLRYTATFAGDFDYTPATDEAAVLHLLGAKAL